MKSGVFVSRENKLRDSGGGFGTSKRLPDVEATFEGSPFRWMTKPERSGASKLWTRAINYVLGL